MKRPMTTAELFDKICSILKEKGKLPNILDYYLGSYRPEPITTYEFDVSNNLDYGGNEGIYLDLYLVRQKDGSTIRQKLGTFKTLDTSDEDMHTMAALLADFIIESTRYVNANLDDFTWEGADVRAVDESGNVSGWSYSCATMKNALERKDKLLADYPKVVIRDNATRKETVYERS